MPRDPNTFYRPQDRKAAFSYYVTRLRGGLDYANLTFGDGERLEEEFDASQIKSWCHNLPKVMVGDNPPRLRTVEDQIEFWRSLASLIHQRMNELDSLIELAHQGRNRRLVVDAEYGGFYFKYLRLPDPGNKGDSGLFLFGATLNQSEMNNGNAEQHFQYLLEALDNIERSIRIA